MPLDSADGSHREPVTRGLRGPTSIRSVALGIIAFIAVVFALKLGKHALVPIVLAVFLGYAMMPFVLWLKRRLRIPQPLGAAVAIALLVLGIGLGAVAVQPQVSGLVDAVPRATQKLKAVLHRTALDRNSTVRRLTTAADELEKATGAGAAGGNSDLAHIPEDSPLKLRDYVWRGTAAMIGGLAQAGVVLALSYFLLISGHDFKRKLVRISGDTLRQKKVTVQILEEIDLQIQRYLMIQVGTSAMVGVFTGLAFAALGLQNALFWGIAAGVLHLVPYIGSALVIGAAAVFAYLQFTTLTPVVLVIGSALLIAGGIGLGVVPWMTQRMARLNAVATFVSLVVWDWLWGVPGLLLGVPIMMALMAVCERIDTLRPVAELLNAEAPRAVPAVSAPAV